MRRNNDKNNHLKINNQKLVKINRQTYYINDVKICISDV